MTRRAAALVIALPLVLLAACGGDEDANLVGYEVSPVPQVGDHRLDDAATGRTDVPLRAEPGRLLVAFLGFTNCPDACPTALAEVRSALERLGDEASIVDVAMVTVDPQRDTPEILTDFVQNFDSDAWALRTDDPDELQQVVTAFGATSATEHDHQGATTDVGHTDYTYVIDDTGAVVLTWTAEMTTDDLVADLTILIARTRQDR